MPTNKLKAPKGAFCIRAFTMENNMTKTQRRRAQRKRAKMQTISWNSSEGFVTESFNCPMEKRKETMKTTESEIQREYLLRRLDNIIESKIADLGIKYGLREMNRPATSKEAKERIAAGLYVLQDGVFGGWDWLWKDPKVTSDPVKYTEALEALWVVKTQTKDQIMISTPADALKAVQDFEATPI